jgi:hypothetical protein
MNKRIDELFGQALDLAVPDTWTTLDPAQLSKLKEKFAELIVAECIDICIEGTATQMTSTGAAQFIKLRFGIE